VQLYSATEGEITFYNDDQDEFILVITKGDFAGREFYGETSSQAQERYCEALRVNREHAKKSE